MYILFADDNEEDRNIIGPIVKQMFSCELVECEGLDDLDSTIAKAGNSEFGHPSLILLDMQIDDDDTGGLKLLRAARKAFPETPVLILSSSSLQTVVRKSYALGASSYIQKPVDRTDVEKTLENLHSYWNNTSILPAV